MKKFSTLHEYVKPKYESKDLLKNKIFDIIDESLALKITNEKKLDSDVDIHGKEELVEKLKELIDDIRIKERTLTLETVKSNVYRNFDMKWLNEKINTLKKLKVVNEDLDEMEDIDIAQPAQPAQSVQKTEPVQDLVSTQSPESQTEVKDTDVLDTNVDKNNAGVAHYIAKKMNEIKKIGTFSFEYEPSDGILRFVNDDEGIIVKATPFYTEDDELPIEVFDEKQTDTHIFIENRDFDINEMALEKYINIMEKFLVDEFDTWVERVNKFDSNSGEKKIF